MVAPQAETDIAVPTSITISLTRRERACNHGHKSAVLAKPHISLMANHYTIRTSNWDYLSIGLENSQGVRQGIQGYIFLPSCLVLQLWFSPLHVCPQLPLQTILGTHQFLRTTDNLGLMICEQSHNGRQRYRMRVARKQQFVYYIPRIAANWRKGVGRISKLWA